MTVRETIDQLNDANGEFQWLYEQQAQQAAAARAQLRVQRLERRLERDQAMEVALAIDPDYPRKLAEARQAEADAAAALDRVTEARARGGSLDDDGENKAVVKLKIAGAMLRSPTPAEQMAADAWKVNHRLVREFERWPSRVAVAAEARASHARSLARANARRAERGMPPAATRPTRRNVEPIPAVEERLGRRFRMPSLGGF